MNTKHKPLIARSPSATLARLGATAVVLTLVAVAAWGVAAARGGATVRSTTAQDAAPRPSVAGAAFAATLVIRPAGSAPVVTLNSEGLMNRTGDLSATIRTSANATAISVIAIGETVYVGDVAGGSAMMAIGRSDLAALFSPEVRDPRSVPVCRGSSSSALAGLLADPFAAMSASGRMTPAGSDSFGGVAVNRYTGFGNVGQMTETMAAFLGVDSSCVGFSSAIMTALSGFASANSIPVTAQVWLGEKDSFPYRIRLEVANTRGALAELDVTLTPRETATQISAPR